MAKIREKTGCQFWAKVMIAELVEMPVAIAAVVSL
jgi:hypothetical protein